MADEENTGTKLVFDHQCFLIDYVDILAPLNAQCPYENYHAMTLKTGDSVHDAIAGLGGVGALKRLTNLRPSEQGILQPKVRLWRVFPAKASDTLEDEEDEFVFDQSLSPTTVDAMLNSTYGRAGGSGIKSFEWEFGGTNPAEAEAVIMVKMTLHFQNMAELQRGWGDTTDSSGFEAGTAAGNRPSFMELILLPPGSKLPNGEYDPAFYKIKASVGWSIPPNLMGEDEQLVRELRSTQLIMYLNLLTHEIKIKEDGSLEVDVEYVGSTEVALEAGSADVLFPIGSSPSATVNEGSWWNPFNNDDDRTVEDVDAEIAALEEAMEDNAESLECASEDQELNEERDEMLEDLGDLQDAKAAVDSNNRTQAYETFTKNLSKYIRHLDLDNGFLKDWEKNVNNERVRMTPGNCELTVGDQEWFSNPAEEAADADASDVADDDVYYVYFGDIIEQACMSFGPAAQDVPDNDCRNMKLITGPIQYSNPRTAMERLKKGEPPDIITVNMCDVPISYTLFLKFWNDNVVDPERDSYPVRTFLRDVIQKLIAPVFSAGCFPNAPAQQATVSTAIFSVASSGGPRDLIGEMPGSGRKDVGSMKSFLAENGSIAGAEEKAWTYIFLYMNTGALGSGNRVEDESRGIYHYKIGEDRGLLKKLDFKKNDVQGMKEARQDDSGAVAQLREMYNADVTMLGNNIYIPGMTLFLWPPPGLGNPAKCGTDANLLGLGGYYNVIKVRSTIKRGGQYDTKLDCIFTASSSNSCSGDDGGCGDGGHVNAEDEGDWWDAVEDAWDSVVGGDYGGAEGVDDDSDGACSGKESGGFSDWFGW